MNDRPTPDSDLLSAGDVAIRDRETFDARTRDEKQLLRALTVALQALGTSGDRVKALNESFAHARAGLAAQKALLLYIREGEPRPEILFAAGLTADQQRACVEMVSSEGVSPTVIRKVIKNQEPVFIENSQARTVDERSTGSLQGGAHSVVAAPVIDPVTQSTIAVLYFENKGMLHTFEAEDLAWLTAFTTALGQGFGLYLSQSLRTKQVEEAAEAASAEAANLRMQLVAGAPEFVGDSRFIRDLQDRLNDVYLPYVETDNPKPILILGDSGSGKELVARYLHYYSQRRHRKPFIAENCGVLTGDTVLTTLFGHRRGAFTGAIEDQPGKFRAADKGTLFLDEIGELSAEAQAMLLRVIEDRCVYPLGETKGQPIDIQLVLATNRDLEERVKEGKFRHDLLSRISALKIPLKPLGSVERRSDIRPLLAHFLAKQERALRKKTKGFSAEAFKALMSYSWPGNVREIDNVCTSVVMHTRPGETIELRALQMLWPNVLEGPRHPEPPGLFDDDARTLDEAKEILERELLIRRFERFDGDAIKVAKSLSIVKSSVYRLADKHGIRTGPRARSDEGE